MFVTSNGTPAANRQISLSMAHDIRESLHVDERGGAYFAYEQSNDGRLTISVGDACAKGLKGRRCAHVLKRTFRMAALRLLSPRSILDDMSASLQGMTRVGAPADDAAAVFVATVDPCKASITYASAGVEGAMVFHSVSLHEHLHATGPLLGTEPRFSYLERTVPFVAGDVLMAYSVGITDARSALNSRVLGTHGLARIAHEMLRSAAAPTCAPVWEQIDRYSGALYRRDANLAVVTALEAAPAAFLTRGL